MDLSSFGKRLSHPASTMAAPLNPFIHVWLKFFNCTSCEELYTKLQQIHEEFKPVEGEHVPFALQELKQFPSRVRKIVITTYLGIYLNAYKSDKLIKDLRKNPPKESFENPVVQQCSSYEEWVAMGSLMHNIDLPGSKYNPPGLGYYSDLFFDSFFGNFSVFNEQIRKLTKEELKKKLNTREGYPQFSPVFAPIIGRKMVFIEDAGTLLTDQNIKDIRLMYNGDNENKHVKILEKLLKLGADPNAHDILGNTPLSYASVIIDNDCLKIASLLLRYGANPNYGTLQYESILDSFIFAFGNSPEYWSVIDLLLSYNAKPTDYEEAMKIRYFMEGTYTVDYVVKIRESFPKNIFPKKDNICERTFCEVSTVKKCGACGFVVYCTPACQKLDWKFHKPTCKKKREEKALENSV